MNDAIANRIYMALAATETLTPGLTAWLKKRGHGELATCTTCGREGFQHKRGCVMADAISMLGSLQRPPAIAHSHRPRSAPR